MVDAAWKADTQADEARVLAVRAEVVRQHVKPSRGSVRPSTHKRLKGVNDMEWQPISTAPKDGSVILLHGKTAISNGWFGGLGSAWVWPYIYAEPLYWMPLPEAPLG